eukprot:5016189-Pleurochrysis_carterae.AAC.1
MISPPVGSSNKWGGGGVPCNRCGKVAFAAERIVVNKCTFHKDCFRCTTCNKLLGSVWERDKESGEFYCKHDFMSLSRMGTIVGVEKSEETVERKALPPKRMSFAWLRRCACWSFLFVVGICTGVAIGAYLGIEFPEYVSQMYARLFSGLQRLWSWLSETFLVVCDLVAEYAVIVWDWVSETAASAYQSALELLAELQSWVDLQLHSGEDAHALNGTNVTNFATSSKSSPPISHSSLSTDTS